MSDLESQKYFLGTSTKYNEKSVHNISLMFCLKPMKNIRMLMSFHTELFFWNGKHQHYSSAYYITLYALCT